MHHRTLALNVSGRRLLGIDRLAGKQRYDALAPGHSVCHSLPPAPVGALPPRRQSQARHYRACERSTTWWFSLEGARLAIEESTYFANSAGPRRALQLVARGATFGEAEVRWVLEAQDETA